ncbi:ferritin, chloroplastic-like [Orbicella faveolata]|uniref:ferritin, chloroplastic-like n=1 Tax=Orbicella faveolata TaxID=48498 RepID=UPI0009E4FFB5|nr:ferritin, chloroplastic-like [Orbicella faveolata]
MISLVYLISFLFAVDVASGNKAKCNLTAHIAAHEDHWVYPNYKDYKGEDAEHPPRPRVSPFATETEKEINKQINRELFAHYTYMSMAVHFDRDDINLPGFHKFFKESSEEELKHAHLVSF